MKGWLAAAAASFVVGAALAVWAFWLEPASLDNRDYDLQLSRWPAACDGLRVAVLADLHVGSPYNGMDNLTRVVDRTLRARPDLILLAGDYVIHGVFGGTFVSPEELAVELGRLAAPAGVFAVLGNHDWWLGSGQVRRALEEQGIGVLENAAHELAIRDCRLWLAGVGDYWIGTHDVKRALARVPAGAPVIAFTHNPDMFPLIPARVALTVAGHTHGGQVCIPGIGRPRVPSEDGERYAIGHIVEDDKHLFVSPGVGTSIFPVRFLVPPEISVLRLTSATSRGPASPS